MKRIFIAAFAALAVAFNVGATTLNPIQLLNPTGSASGQAIVSTGASTAPAWGGIGLNGIAPIPANTVLANATGSSAAPTAFAMPNCSSSTGVLTYTAGTGFQCSSAIGVTTGVFTGAITPSQTSGIVGTTTNNNANAGSVGEYQTVTGGSSGITNATNTNMTSISLTAGDWDAQCSIAYTPAAGTTVTGYTATISTTSAAGSTLGSSQVISGTSLTTSFGLGIAVSPMVRFSLASTTTVFCAGLGAFSGGTLSAQGFIRARRVR